MKEFLKSLGKDGLKAAYNALSAFALYLTLALAVVLVAAYFIVKVKANDKLGKFKTIAFGITVGYAVTLTACISLFMLARLGIKHEIDGNFYLILGFFALLFVYAVTTTILALTNKKAFNVCNYVGLSAAAIYGAILLSVLPTAGEDYAPLSFAGMYVFSALLIIAIALPTIFFGKDEGTASATKSIAFAGVSIAIAFALSYIKLFSLPQGGSVTLASMLPLIIYAYVFGARKGVFAGVIYGILQCLQNPQIYQPMQVILDYPVAFGAIGLAGIVKNLHFLKTPLVKFIFGATIACIGRYAAHFLSGYYVFSSWAMEGYTALTWSLVYNLFVIVDLVIVLAVGCALFASKGITGQIESINPVTDNADND
ncbi:MAG: energy-coupled thiamine transporter ThiT [Clostridia bacterium]|nr:energy-coupled thiamine transporter ThiT [Clostridia bacterium]